MFLFTYFYNSPSPILNDMNRGVYLRTVIVTADIHQGIHSPACITLRTMQVIK